MFNKQAKTINKETIQSVSGFLNSVINKVPSSKEEINDILQNKISKVYFYNDLHYGWNYISAKNFINKLSESQYNLLIKYLTEKISKKHKEREFADSIEMEVKEKYPNILFAIKDICVYNKNSYGIKMYLKDRGYLFDFDGTKEELIELICDQI